MTEKALDTILRYLGVESKMRKIYISRWKGFGEETLEEISHHELRLDFPKAWIDGRQYRILLSKR